MMHLANKCRSNFVAKDYGKNLVSQSFWISELQIRNSGPVPKEVTGEISRRGSDALPGISRQLFEYKYYKFVIF